MIVIIDRLICRGSILIVIVLLSVTDSILKVIVD